jgi:hypothetical protein
MIVLEFLKLPEFFWNFLSFISIFYAYFIFWTKKNSFPIYFLFSFSFSTRAAGLLPFLFLPHSPAQLPFFPFLLSAQFRPNPRLLSFFLSFPVLSLIG